MLAGLLNLLDGGQSACAVSELFVPALHDRSHGKLPRLVACVCFHANNPEVSALERPGLNGTPDINPFIQESDEDRHRLGDAAPSVIEPPANRPPTSVKS